MFQGATQLRIKDDGQRDQDDRRPLPQDPADGSQSQKAAGQVGDEEHSKALEDGRRRVPRMSIINLKRKKATKRMSRASIGVNDGTMSFHLIGGRHGS